MTGEQQINPDEFIVAVPNGWSVADRWMTDVLSHDVPASVVILIVVLTQLPWWVRVVYTWLRRR
jgi:hypothetical protein